MMGAMPERASADVDAQVSRTVRGLAAAREITYASLAAVCGVGTTQFSAKMRGQAPWKLREAARLAAHLGVTLDELVSGQVPLTDHRPSDYPA